MHSLNDLVVVGDDQFFFTNYYYMVQALEFIYRIPWGSFGFFDGTRSTLLETKLRTPNGISTSPDGKLVDDILIYLLKTHRRGYM